MPEASRPQPKTMSLPGREAVAEPTTDDKVRAEAASELASTLFFLREDLEDALSAATIAVDSSAHSETRALHAHAMAQKGVIEAVMGHPDALATLRAADELKVTMQPFRGRARRAAHEARRVARRARGSRPSFRAARARRVRRRAAP